MRNLRHAFQGTLILLVVLWLVAEPTVFRSNGFFALRGAMVQLTGVVAIGCMGLAMVLALRPLWPQTWLGGLDKMYRLHKWLGIAALVAAILHWLWAKGPKWAVGWGWLERPARGPRAPSDSVVGAWLSGQRGLAESIGEWTFYAVVILIALALIQRFPYRLFHKTHRLLAVTWLALAWHTLVLMKPGYWLSPVGWLVAALLVGGTWAALVVLAGRVGAGRKVPGTVKALHWFNDVRSLEIEVELRGWPGHKPGQYAFVTVDAPEGAHPFTITSSWDPADPVITFGIRELGDYTRGLRNRLAIGQPLKVEGPYGCFTFDDDRAHQIWIGGGVGVTPFIARMKHLAREQADPDSRATRQIHLFHTTVEPDQEVFERLARDARLAQVQLHILVDARDGLLTGERLRSEVPEWRKAGIWFCGPAGFGEALKRDLAGHGFPVDTRFHQELFSMR
ncbi:ferric reductase-like transmembrane domain-containing protein [Luteimonas sp. MJ204]|uniref:ferredoxin reductase family protein n=1 Tax=Luteimonas sp. MJ145 TaxID=3129234 RepID=UPI0031BBAC42